MNFLDGKRKFWATVYIMVMSSIGLFSGKLDQGGYVTIMTMCLGIYAGANIVDKKLGGAG